MAGAAGGRGRLSASGVDPERQFPAAEGVTETHGRGAGCGRQVSQSFSQSVNRWHFAIFLVQPLWPEPSMRVYYRRDTVLLGYCNSAGTKSINLQYQVAIFSF